MVIAHFSKKLKFTTVKNSFALKSFAKSIGNNNFYNAGIWYNKRGLGWNASVKNVGKKPKGLYLTWVVNWVIKPFTMFAIASLFFLVIFKSLIPANLANDYLAGAVLLGAAPCTAMVFVWSSLTRGNPAYTLVQVATNDLIILVLFVPIVGLFG